MDDGGGGDSIVDKSDADLPQFEFSLTTRGVRNPYLALYHTLDHSEISCRVQCTKCVFFYPTFWRVRDSVKTFNPLTSLFLSTSAPVRFP